MDDPEMQDALSEIDAYDNYNTKRAEVEANAAADDAPMPTVISLDDVDPVPTEVNLEAPADAAKGKLKAHKNALDEQVKQDVMRMAKEMGVDYEDLFAAAGGPTPDEVETSAEKKREAKDPQAEQKEPVHQSKPAPAPVPQRRKEAVQAAAPRAPEARHAELKAQAQQHSTPKPAAKAEEKPAPKAEAKAEAPKAKASAAPHKAETAHGQAPTLHRSPSAQRLHDEAWAASMRASSDPSKREQYGKEAVHKLGMEELEQQRNSPDRGKAHYPHLENPKMPPSGAPAPTPHYNREVSPVLEQMHRNGQINDADYRNMVKAIRGE